MAVTTNPAQTAPHPHDSVGKDRGRRLPAGLFARLFTIRIKIFTAFAAMSCITALLGWYGTGLIAETGRLVAETYDKPLTAINYARAVMADFAAAEAVFVRLRYATDPKTREELEQRLKEVREALAEDLDIVALRSASERSRRALDEVRAAIAAWEQAGQAVSAGEPTGPLWQDFDRSALNVHEEVDLLVNFAAGDGFVARSRALEAVRSNGKLYAFGILAALVLSTVITLLLARRIVGPVRSASQAAARIARGELDFAMPPAGADELGALLGSMSVMRDHIRATIADEKAQRRSAQARMVDAVESSREGIIVVDDRGRIVIANSQTGDFLPELKNLLLPGANFARMALTAIRCGALAPGSLGKVRSWIGGQEPFSAFEAEPADGRWLQLSFSPTRDGGFVAIGSEITGLKERETILRTAKEQAEAANRSKTEFLTNMSHELRTPLNAVIGFSEILSMELYGPLGNPSYKEFAGDILASGRHLLDVINDILDIAKSEAGKLHVSIEPVELASLFEACRKMVQEQSTRAEIVLDIAAPEAPLTIVADPVKSKQILLNLLSNALKFTDPGGRVSMRAEALGNARVAITVTDTGIGMSEADIAVALTPFGQVNTGLSRKYEGTGLGLPLTKALVDLQGGMLAIDSSPGKGTAVEVTFPLLDRAWVPGLHHAA